MPASTPSFSSQQFIQLALANQVLKFGEFTLKSGRISPYFFNAGLLSTGESLSLLACGYADFLATVAQQQAQIQTDSEQTQELVIFGAAYKGIPFVAATAQALWLHHGINASWGYNRKEAKTHGEGGSLVGAQVQGKSVWILDDVITAGTAMREVVSLLTEAGARVAGIVVALDRKERGLADKSAIQELAEQLDVPVHALVSMDDIIDFLQPNQPNQPSQSSQASRQTAVDEYAADDGKHLAAMQAYRQHYGV